MNKKTLQIFLIFLWISIFGILNANILYCQGIIEEGKPETIVSVGVLGKNKIWASHSHKGIKIWEWKSKKLLFHILPEEETLINSAIFSKDGKFILMACENGTVQIASVEEKSIISTLPHKENVLKAIYSPDERTIISVTSPKSNTERYDLFVWDPLQEKLIGEYSIDPKGSRALCTSPDEKIAIGGNSGILVVRNLKKEILRIKAHPTVITDVAFCPKGRYLASSSMDYTVKIWDLHKNGRLRHKFTHPSLVSSIAFSPNGRYLAAGCYNGKVYIWDLRWGSKKSAINIGESIEDITYTEDGKWIISGGIKNIHLWNVKDKSLRTIPFE